MFVCTACGQREQGFPNLVYSSTRSLHSRVHNNTSARQAPPCRSLLLLFSWGFLYARHWCTPYHTTPPSPLRGDTSTEGNALHHHHHFSYCCNQISLSNIEIFVHFLSDIQTFNTFDKCSDFFNNLSNVQISFYIFCRTFFLNVQIFYTLFCWTSKFFLTFFTKHSNCHTLVIIHAAYQWRTTARRWWLPTVDGAVLQWLPNCELLILGAAQGLPCTGPRPYVKTCI